MQMMPSNPYHHGEENMTAIKMDGFTVEEVYHNMKQRNVADSTAALAKVHVVIAGAGGLGSNIAIGLARSGVGHLTLIDFDVVDHSNLNRQQFKLSQVGVPKVLALKQNILEFNPFIEITTIQAKVTADNIEEFFKDADVMVEAFDVPDAKALLFEVGHNTYPEKPLVMGNGMAGVHSANLIQIREQTHNVYIAGDYTNPGSEGLMAGRVMVAAGHQTNMILQLLLDKVAL